LAACRDDAMRSRPAADRTGGRVAARRRRRSVCRL